jgi:aldehyde:ferredoxin oxidoreductase
LLGYAGQILHVNLTDGSIEVEALPEDYPRKFLGGRGLGAKLLWDETRADIEPLDPENRVIFSTGPLTGTGLTTSNKFTLTTKSPLTGIYAVGNAGGKLGIDLKNSGYDALVIKGASEKPVYVFVNSEKVSIEDAGDLWGSGNVEVIRKIKERLGSTASSASIGQAGENLVRYASVITDDMRSFGRCGGGAVMGSKKLKAVVARANPNVRIADRSTFFKLMKEINDKMAVSPVIKRFKTAGTQGGPQEVGAWGIHPTRNWSKGVFEKESLISYPYLREKYVVRDTGCPVCTIHCTHATEVKEGPYASSSSYGPEYETLYALGSSCDIGNAEPIIAADSLCDSLGLDTMSAGLTISFVMECYEKGFLNSNDLDGIDLRFGNDRAMLTMIERIAMRKGFGNKMAEGTKELAKIIGKGSEKFAMHAKGLELGGYDPRGSKGQGLTYAIGNRGGCHHTNGLASRSELPESRLEYKGKGRFVKKLSSEQIILDSAVLCSFGKSAFQLDLLAKLFTAVTGVEYDLDMLEEIGCRVNTLERAYNTELGITRKDDVLPRRILEDPLPGGLAKGEILKPEGLEQMKDEYYNELGWDIATGIPTKSTLERLGMPDVAERLVMTKAES